MVEHELSAIVQYPLLDHCGEPPGSRNIIQQLLLLLLLLQPQELLGKLP